MQKELIESVNQSDNIFKTQILKNIAINHINRAFEIKNRFYSLKENIEANNHNEVSEIILDYNDAVIFLERANKKNDWSTKYPYRVALKNSGGTYKVCPYVSATLEEAMVIYLTEKQKCSNMAVPIIKLLDLKVEDED